MKPRRTAPHRTFVSPFDRPVEPEPEPVIYEVNDRVSHDQHGLGVVSVAESPNSVVVNFGSGPSRRITLPCAKMQRL